MARGNFGERLKRERELREVTLAEITAATRIGPRFLEALENEDWSKLPGGVFNRGFVRSIARYLGLDEEALLGDYDLAHAEHLTPAQEKPENRIPPPPRWLPFAVVLGFLALLAGLIFAGIYGWKKYQEYRVRKAAAPAALLADTMFAGNSSALLLELNGRTMPPLGAPGASSTITLDRKDLK